MLKRTLKRAVIGALIGMVAGILIPCLFGDHILSAHLVEKCGSESRAMLLTLLLTGIMGFLDCAGMTFYEMEHWSLLRILASHLAVIYAAFLPTAFILDWINSMTELMIICGCMLVGYFIVWRIMCAVYKKQVKELNEINDQANKDRHAA